MSYANPKVSYADPYAFQRGFEGNFDRFAELYKNRKAEWDEIEKQKQEAMAAGYNAASMDPIESVSMNLNSGIQDALNGVIDAGDFANADSVEKTKMLQKIGQIKQGADALGGIASVPYEDWDKRNSPTVTKLKNALTKGDPSLRVEGEGLDLKIVGDFGEVSWNELTSANVRSTEEFQSEMDDINENFSEQFTKMAEKAIEKRMPMEALRAEAKKAYFKSLQSKGPGFLSYLYSNEASDGVHEANKSMLYGDPEVLKQMSKEEQDAYINSQFNSMAEEQFTNAMESIADPTFYTAPDPIKSSGGSSAMKPTAKQRNDADEARRAVPRIKRINEMTLERPDNLLNPEELGRFEQARPMGRYWEQRERMPVDLYDPKIQNALAGEGIVIESFSEDEDTGDVSATLSDQVSGDKTVVNLNGLSGSEFKKILTRLISGGREVSPSGLPILN